MRRTVYNEDHQAFRDTIRSFIEAEVVPVYDEWLAAGQAPREFYQKLGELGIFGIEVPEEFGGAGEESFKFQAIISEECARAGVSFGGSGVHVALCLPYLKAYATEDQKKRWLPDFASGASMFAIAMTEPGTGSDLAGMKTTAKLSADGTHYVLNGAKTFITGGVHADRVIVCARTAAPTPEDRRYGISLLVVDTRSEGYAVGRKLDKLGLKTSDTAELSFSDVKVPVEDLLGEENKGFSYLGQNLPQGASASRSGRTRRPPPPSGSPRRTCRTAPCSARPSRRSRTPSSNWPPVRPRSTRPRPSATARSKPTTWAS